MTYALLYYFVTKNNFFPSPSEEQNRKKITEARIQVQKNKNLKKDMLNRYSKPVNKIKHISLEKRLSKKK